VRSSPSSPCIFIYRPVIHVALQFKVATILAALAILIHTLSTSGTAIGPDWMSSKLVRAALGVSSYTGGARAAASANSAAAGSRT
jgi:hypothetical protein